MTNVQLLNHIDGLYRYAVALTRNRHEAGDLVQETYVRALTSIERLQTRDKPQMWLFTVMRRVWQDQTQRGHTDPMVDLSIGDSAAGVAMVTNNIPHLPMTERQQVLETIRKLPVELREIIILREYESLSYDDIANLLDCPLSSVMVRIARARGELRALLYEGQQSHQPANE